MINWSNINLGSPVKRDSPLNYGLVAWWLPLPNNQGGGKLFDIAATNHGTLTGVDPATDWVPGNAGTKSLDFDGAGDYIACGDLSSFFTTTASFATWMRVRDATPAAAGKTGFVTGDSAASTHFPWTTGTVYVSLFSTLRRINNFTIAVNLENWTHVAVTSSPGAGNYILYLNGAAITTGTGDATIANVSDWRLGTSDTSGSYFLDGQMHDSRLFNRQLSSSEVQSLYVDSLTGYRETLSRKVRFGRPSAPAAPAGGTNHHFLPLLGAA